MNDSARVATREQVSIAKFDHDPCGDNGQHAVGCRPYDIAHGVPQWYIGGQLVTDPEEIAALEKRLKE